jgi:hypothetical protein
MREFFKYEFGYINIDSENLYLTNSGNWSEIKNLKEKSVKTISDNNQRKMWIFIFLAIASIILLTMLVIHLKSSKISLVLCIGAPFAAYKLYKYFQNELGSKYCIPLKKINSIELNDKNAVIHFKDFNNNDNSEEVVNIGDKGIKILSEVNLLLFKK